jgi:hypothetical protein
MIIHSGTVARLEERLDQFQALAEALDLGFRAGLGQLCAQPRGIGLQVDGLQQLEHGFGTHQRGEIITVLLDGLQILLIRKQLPALHGGESRINDDEGFEIQHLLDVFQRHIQQQADTRRKAFRNQICATGDARSICPMRSRRTLV